MAAALQSSSSWQDPSVKLPEPVIEEFGELVAAAAKPLDDVRGTAAYRRHGCRVLARRAITWALNERRLPAWL
jgi:CO/xanthine dehydrogenase FAD-binding subunit